MEKETFGTYVNAVHRYTRGHRTACGQAKKNGGHRTKAGGHIGPFDSPDEAELAGHESGFPFSWCTFCCSDLTQTTAHEPD
jgi:hypothetical protein